MIKRKPKITYLTSGAAGMYCGSCMHDNTLVRALIDIGCDVSLVPTYTPIRTDETSVAVDQVFFGGINVYLQQKIPIFRWLPGFMDRFLDNPKLIRRATSRSIEMKPEVLGKLAVSMLKGKNGNQRKEVARLTHWLQKTEKPDLLVLTNLLIGGAIASIKQHIDLPVIVTLQGDDVFLDSLPGEYKDKCISLMREIATQVDGFITHSEFYREYMADYLGIDLKKIHVTPLGLETHQFEHLNVNDEQLGSSDERTIGYLARLAPEKGLHVLVDAFIELQQRNPSNQCRLLIGGWLGHDQEKYAEEQFTKLKNAGLDDRYEHLGSIDRKQKLEMYERLDVMCVPATFLEPKGLYALEAMAAGIPVIAPDHGAFPEMIKHTSGGVLFKPNDSTALAEAMHKMLSDHHQRKRLATQGRDSVQKNRNAESMAHATLELFEKFL